MSLSEKQFLLTGAPRSGGSLLCSLFDGHPALRTFPFKPRFAARWDYPLHSVEPNATLRDHLVQVGRLELFNRVLAASKVSSVEGNLEQFEKALQLPCPRQGFSIVEAVSTAFFAALGDRESSGALVWHATNMHWGNLENALMRFPGLTVIGVIRHPLETILSYKAYKKDWKLDTHTEFFLNLHALVSLTRLASRFPERAHIVRYEELVSGPEQTMKDLARKLGLPYDPCLISPTILGRPWVANSSHAASRVQGVIAPLHLRFASDSDIMKFAGEQPERKELLAACGYFLGAPFFSETLPCATAIPNLHDRLVAEWAQDYLAMARAAQPSMVRRVVSRIETLRF